MNSDNPEELNYDCNYNMFLAKTLLHNLPSVRDRQQVVKWMKKLSLSNSSVTEMKLRNDFMYYLVLNIQNNALKEPFINDPPLRTLMEISHLLPRDTDGVANIEAATAWASSPSGGSPTVGQQRPFLYANSPDGGSFLASQPIPRCGAFCYLAVVSRSNK